MSDNQDPRKRERRFYENHLSPERRAKIEKRRREGKVARYLPLEQIEAKTKRAE